MIISSLVAAELDLKMPREISICKYYYYLVSLIVKHERTDKRLSLSLPKIPLGRHVRLLLGEVS